MLISKFWPLGEGFQGFGPQIRLQHAEISPGTNSEVIWLELKGFPKFCPVAFQWPVCSTAVLQIILLQKLSIFLTGSFATSEIKIKIFATPEIPFIPTKRPQNLSPGRFRHAEVESEVQNLEILHLEAKI